MNTTRSDTLATAPVRLLRPGVGMPDWSAVTSETAAHALEAVFAAAGRNEKWSGLSADEDRVWQAILEGFASVARPPCQREISAATDLPPDLVGAALNRLIARDLVMRVGETEAIAAAYPF